MLAAEPKSFLQGTKNLVLSIIINRLIDLFIESPSILLANRSSNMYMEKISRSTADIDDMRKAPSLVDLCVRTAIDNVRYLGDVGETDSNLLERILPHCTIDQLSHVEKSTTERDLTPVTDKLWKNFYELQFGRESMKVVIQRMKVKKVAFRWRQLYEAKLKEVQEAENKAVDRLKQLYKKEDARKQSRQVQLCSKVPPSSKRSFFAGSGPGGSFSNVKSNIMKKSKIDFMKSHEVKNLAAMKKKAVQSHHSGTIITKPTGFSGKNSASTSRHTKPFERKF